MTGQLLALLAPALLLLILRERALYRANDTRARTAAERDRARQAREQARQDLISVSPIDPPLAPIASLEMRRRYRAHSRAHEDTA